MAEQETQVASDEDTGAQAVARAQQAAVPGGLRHLFRQRRAASGQLNRLERERARMQSAQRAAQEQGTAQDTSE